MMRIVWIILLMGALAVGVVQLRAGQNAARAEAARLEAQWWKTRRRLWNQQLRLSVGRLARPSEAVGERPAVELVGPGEAAHAEALVRRADRRGNSTGPRN